MSMMCRPMWPFLLTYGSHDMRHTGFSQVDGGQWDPQEMGRHNLVSEHRYTSTYGLRDLGLGHGH